MAATTGVGQSFSPTAVSGVSGSQSSAARSRSRSVTQALFVVTDILLLWTNAAIVLWLRFIAGDGGARAAMAKNAGYLFLFSILVVLFAHTQRLYRGIQVRSPLDEAFAVLKAIALAALMLSASLYLARALVVSRIALGTTVVGSAITLVLWRYRRRRRMAARVAAGYDCQNVLLFGDAVVANVIEKHLADNPHLGYRVKGVLDRRSRDVVGADSDCANGHLGCLDELSRVVRAHFIDELFIVLPESRETVKEVVEEARQCGTSIRVIPDLYDGLAWGAPIESLGAFPTMEVHEKPHQAVSLLLKRCFDIVGASMALILCSPIMLLAAIAIRFDTCGPVLYRSQRVGRKGQTFTCYKFRTMVDNADAVRDSLRHLNERHAVLFKIANDPRITRVGRFLRKYSIDELPQLWNVFKGDMSLVGPRPPIPGEYEQYELDHLKRLDVLPGITGLWQVEARRDPSFESYVNLDNHYVDHWSFWLDLKIMCKTVAVVVTGTGQ